MIEIVDGDDFTPRGIRYVGDEVPAVSFALGVYREQLTAGNIVRLDDPALLADVYDVLDGLEELKGQLDDGLTTVNPNQHRALQEVVLPLVVRLHEGMQGRMSDGFYEGVCSSLGVKPFDLFVNAIVSRRIVDGSEVEFEIMQSSTEQG